MKHLFRAITYLLLLATNAVFAQGPLTPPGAPAPTMKTLDQVEPRKEINATNTPGDADSIFRIAQAGSYYLSANVTGVAAKHGVEIISDDVTLDLNGFALVGIVGSLDGVNLNGSRRNIAVRNGTIRSWGASGLDGATSTNVQVRDLMVASNLAGGLVVGTNAVVSACSLYLNTGSGIDANTGAVIHGCAARFNTDDGIHTGSGSTVSNCTASSNTGDGIEVGTQSAVTSCSVRSNTLNGITTAHVCIVSACTSESNTVDGFALGSSTSISGCVAQSNSGDGIVIAANSFVARCIAANNTANGIVISAGTSVLENNCRFDGNGGDGAGILVTSGDNRIEGNNISNCDRGIDVDLGGNLIIRNSATGNGINYDIVADNRYGPIVNITALGTAAVSGSSAADTTTTTHPWAHFSF